MSNLKVVLVYDPLTSLLRASFYDATSGILNSNLGVPYVIAATYTFVKVSPGPALPPIVVVGTDTATAAVPVPTTTIEYAVFVSGITVSLVPQASQSSRVVVGLDFQMGDFIYQNGILLGIVQLPAATPAPGNWFYDYVKSPPYATAQSLIVAQKDGIYEVAFTVAENTYTYFGIYEMTQAVSRANYIRLIGSDTRLYGILGTPTGTPPVVTSLLAQVANTLINPPYTFVVAINGQQISSSSFLSLVNQPVPPALFPTSIYPPGTVITFVAIDCVGNSLRAETVLLGDRLFPLVVTVPPPVVAPPLVFPPIDGGVVGL